MGSSGTETNLLERKLFHKQILDAALLFGNTPALTDAETGECLTFFELRHRSLALAKILRYEYGLKRGDTVISLMQNNIHYPVIFLACASIGCVMCGACSSAKKNEICSLIELTECSAIFTTSELLNDVIQKANEAEVTVFVLEKLFGQIRIDLEKKFENISTEPNNENDYLKSVDEELSITENDVLLMALTSGTTGTPKCALLTHLNFNTATEALKLSVFNKLSAKGEASRSTIALLPFYHASGFWALCYCLLSGHHSVVMRRFEMSAFFSIIQKYQVDTINLVPSIVNFLAKSGKEIIEKFDYDSGSVRTVLCGSSAIKEAQIKEFLKIFPQVDNFLCGYGMTEVVVLSHITPIDLNKEEAAKHANSCGKLLPGFSAKIVDTETGLEVKHCGQSGELWLKSDSVMKGYFKNEVETSLCIDFDGWFHTGDVVHSDKDGFYYVVGRLKNMIKVNGMQVSPMELENILLSHDQVLEAAVIGIPDADRGEVPKAFIVLAVDGNETPEQIEETLSGIQKFAHSQIAPLKQLRGGIINLAILPKTDSGKVAKTELLNMLKSEPKQLAANRQLATESTTLKATAKENKEQKLENLKGDSPIGSSVNKENPIRSTSIAGGETQSVSQSFNDVETETDVELLNLSSKLLGNKTKGENLEKTKNENRKNFQNTNVSDDFCLPPREFVYQGAEDEEAEQETML